jgi:hypothetical protein
MAALVAADLTFVQVPFGLAGVGLARPGKDITPPFECRSIAAPETEMADIPATVVVRVSVGFATDRIPAVDDAVTVPVEARGKIDILCARAAAFLFADKGTDAPEGIVGLAFRIEDGPAGPATQMR